MDRELPLAGETWIHFKGFRCKIVGVGRHTEPPRGQMVAYTHEGEDELHFRPLDMFMGVVGESKGYDVTNFYRFEKCQSEGDRNS